jgi:hypothetical protein
MVSPLPPATEVRQGCRGTEAIMPDKGKVENLIGYARRNYLVPLPRAATFEELNAQLEDRCRHRFDDQLRGHDATIGSHLAADQAAFFDLPAVPYEPCEKRPGRVWYA